MSNVKRRFLATIGTVFALLFGALLLLYIVDKPERDFSSYLETIVCNSAELEHCSLSPHKSAFVTYSVNNETGFLTDSLKVRKLLEKYIQDHMKHFSGAEINLRFAFRNGYVSASYYNYDHINYDHIAEPHHCENTYDLHYAYISDNYNDSLSVLDQDTDLEYLSLSGMKDYDLSCLQNFRNLKKVVIAAPKSANQIQETIDVSLLPDGCSLWIEDRKLK